MNTQADEMLYPTGLGGRFFYNGMYDRTARHGEPVASPEALSAFYDRQERLNHRGKWRHNAAVWKTDDGDVIDKDYEIMEWM